MKRLDDELIARYAFGELSPSEAAEVEALLTKNPEARRLSDAYEGMSLNLRNLQSIPEPQLSTDRLRARILQEGLKPKKSWSLPWTLGPALVGATAFAFAFFRSGPTVGEPVIIAKDNAPSTRVALKEPAPGNTESTISGQIAAAAKATSEPAKPRLAYSASRRGKRTKSTLLTPEKPILVAVSEGTSQPDQSTGFDAAPKEEISRDSGTSSMAISAQPDVALPVSEPLVLIQPETDRGTGAQRATEVSATNVTIGG